MNKERVLDEMARQGVDVLLLGREGNARYVSGARRLFLASERAFAPGCVVVRSTREVQALSNTDLGIPNAGLYATSWNPATVVARVLGIPGVAEAKTIGVDGLTPLFESLLPDVALVDGEAIMRVARRIKTPDEIELLRAAAEVANAVMAAALEAAASGGAVRAIAMETMAAHGVTTAAFEPLVVRGAVAIGVLREGWEADVTRSTTALPNPAIERCRPATPVAGLPPDTHGIGLGYEVLAPDDILEPGMVLSVGVDGTRDTVLVTSGEPEVLTTPSGFG
jgi:Xaa-Pro aminopeptidase